MFTLSAEPPKFVKLLDRTRKLFMLKCRWSQYPLSSLKLSIEFLAAFWRFNRRSEHRWGQDRTSNSCCTGPSASSEELPLATRPLSSLLGLGVCWFKSHSSLA
uniref:(northern house mosquito) hypothetical protein n=1 Tax=Culex pipiens TaxID=7175 RepID=A0A8D8JML1_CULPI